jgi:hypothetical protein
VEDATTAPFFAKGTDGTITHRITTRRGHPSDPTLISVRTYSEVITRYLDHAEAKSADAHGRACESDTRGVLRRRHLIGTGTLHIGKEAHNLEQRRAGYREPSDVAIYRDESEAQFQKILDVLSRFPGPAIASATRPGDHPVLAPGVAETSRPNGEPLWSDHAGVPERTVRDIVSGRTTPTRSHAALLEMAAVRLASDYLARSGRPVPTTAPGSPYVDSEAALSIVLELAVEMETCAAPGCSNRRRRHSRFCSDAHKRRASRARARPARSIEPA